MNFSKISHSKSVENKMPKYFLQALKQTVFLSYTNCLRFQTSDGDYKIM